MLQNITPIMMICLYASTVASMGYMAKEADKSPPFAVASFIALTDSSYAQLQYNTDKILSRKKLNKLAKDAQMHRDLAENGSDKEIKTMSSTGAIRKDQLTRKKASITTLETH